MPLRRIALLAVAGLALAASPAPAADSGLRELVGAVHEHSGYSDGWPGSTPRNYFAAGKAEGLDFLGSGEHSDTADAPIVASEYCAEDPSQCLNADPVNPGDAYRKWPATLEQADAASTPDFTAFRGFEWSSDRFGHINVYFSSEDVNAKADGGYADMDTFYAWLTRPAGAGGGSDGIATFNHPGAKQLNGEDKAAFNWDDFRYVPAADAQMVGLETFNDQRDYGSAGAGAPGGPPPEGWYAHALDRGWHVGAIGAEDLGHNREDNWGGPNRAKTVVLAADGSRQSLEAAMRARRTYAIRRAGIRLSYTVDDRPLGSRLDRRPGEPMRVRAKVTAPAAEGGDLHLDLITSGGKVVATGDETLDLTVPASAQERYYYVRARRGGPAPNEPIAYSSPVWVRAAATAAPGEWLAGDLHVHSCYSGDVSCGAYDPLHYEPGDGDEPAEIAKEPYTYGLTIGQRFLEASARGLDFTAITDHNDVRSSADPSFGGAGVLGVPGYENSIKGHAQMLGATKLYPKGDEGAEAINAEAAALRADGGVFQINHPDYRASGPFSTCAATSTLHWTYGYAVRPDTLELWNPTSPTSAAEAYYECWLAHGERVAATGGSDTHWASLSAAQGQGNPTTWVLAKDRTPDGVLAALRAGRTTISKLPPSEGGARLLLEADADRDGTFESGIGDTVPAGVPMRVRTEDGSASGYVTVRANGATLVSERPLAPGGIVAFDAPADPGWVRATLLSDTGASMAAPGCQPNGQSISTCAYDSLLLGMTSPVYLERSADGQQAGVPPTGTPAGGGEGAEGGDGGKGGEQRPGRPGPRGDAAPSAGPGARGALRVRLELRRRPLTGTVRRRRGLRVRVVCSAACDGPLELRLSRRTARRLSLQPGALLGRRRIRLGAKGGRTVTVRLSRALVRRLRARDAFEVRYAGTPRTRRFVRLRARAGRG